MRFNPFIATALGLASCVAAGAGCAGTVVYGIAPYPEGPYYEGHNGPGPFHDQSYYDDLYGAHGIYDDGAIIAPRDERIDGPERGDQGAPGPVHDHGRN